jgi:hypothetical protein
MITGGFLKAGTSSLKTVTGYHILETVTAEKNRRLSKN